MDIVSKTDALFVKHKKIHENKRERARAKNILFMNIL